MQNKVTNYELSKRLDELGFECESHCGLWSDDKQYFDLLQVPPYLKDKNISLKELTRLTEHKHRLQPGVSIKAYDCWDLLMWLNQNGYETSLESWTDFHVEAPGAIFTQAEEPQSALALAIIKILEEEQTRKGFAEYDPKSPVFKDARFLQASLFERLWFRFFGKKTTHGDYNYYCLKGTVYIEEKQNG